jgi:hypothetical protein
MKKLFLILLLSGCSQKRSKELEKYEQVPPVLYLLPKTKIVAAYGEYTSGDSIEMWHSHKQFTNLQDEISKFRPITSSK